VNALHARTEGWAVGLQLARQSLAERTNIEGFLQDFTGSHRFVLDYLVEEVLATQTVETWEFMMQTSILDRLSGPLCDAVTEQADSQKILTSLEQMNLFLVSLDDTRTWFRYHHLFRDLLRHRLEQQNSDLIPRLHFRASHWFEQNGWTNDAIYHALQAHDYPRTASLITTHALAILRNGQQFSLLHWIEAIPKTARARFPHLCLWHAWVLLFVGRTTEHTAPLQLAEEAWNSTGDRHGLGRVKTFKANLARLQKNPLEAIGFALDALELLPDDDLEQKSICLMSLGDAYTQIGQVNKALSLLDDALVTAPPGSNSLMSLIAKNRRADAYMLKGQLHYAKDIFKTVLDTIGQNPIWQRAEAHTGLSKIHLEWNNLVEAEEHLNQAIELAQQTEREIYLSDIYYTLAQLRCAQGDNHLALDAIHHALDVAHRFYHPDVARFFKAFRARISLKQGDILTATQWNTEIKATTDRNPLLYETEMLVSARLHLAQENPRTAIEQLKSIAVAAKTDERFAICIEANMLMALAFQSLGEMDAALLALGDSLRLAEESGYARMYLNEGQQMEALLRHANQASLFPDYTGQLLGSFALSATVPLVEPLTERELEVLRLMAQGASNKEIATELIIALTTAKKHVSNIIGKLNVSNRTEAVANARDLGIL
jgi:LuxR family maltose regulon positive regulatory protein